MKKPNLQSGFTLVELMVSLTLFVIVVLAAVSSLYSVNNASRKVSAMRSVLDNLNFAVESISRTIRTGSLITCGGTLNGVYGNAAATGHNCRFGIDSATDRLSVHSTLGKEVEVEYSIDGGQVKKRVFANGVWGDAVALTAPEINVQRLAFYVDGADPNDLSQPNVIMFIQGVATATQDSTAPFAVQTYISQRGTE